MQAQEHLGRPMTPFQQTPHAPTLPGRQRCHCGTARRGELANLWSLCGLGSMVRLRSHRDSDIWLRSLRRQAMGHAGAHGQQQQGTHGNRGLFSWRVNLGRPLGKISNCTFHASQSIYLLND
jgi:hypothetical protein